MTERQEISKHDTHAWHAQSVQEVCTALQASEDGLASSDVQARLDQYGPNALPEAKRSSYLEIFMGQFKSPVIYVLLIATAIVMAMGDITDGFVIFIVLFINAIIGAVQEGKAQNTLLALQKMVTTEATVLRNGREDVISDVGIVPGDILILREGDKISADARLISVHDLVVDESAMTGESETIEKKVEIIPLEPSQGKLAPADQRNMVFKGTYVIGGEARAIVVATGEDTVIGRISVRLGSLETDVPLKASIAKLSRFIIVVVIAISALIFVAGVLKGFDSREMFSSVVAIAVSAIPEGLPVVVTVILATGMYRMSKRNALVKKLQAVEALGQASIVAVDKTGTITLNQMMVEKAFTDGVLYDVGGRGYEPHGLISQKGDQVEPLDHAGLVMMGKISALSSHASVAYAEDTKEWKRLSGDPTEAALLSFSQKIGFHKQALEQDYASVFKLPFTSHLKYQAGLYEKGSEQLFCVVGAPEVVLEHCAYTLKNGKETEASVADMEARNAALSQLVEEGFRVLALAVKLNAPKSLDMHELPKLCFVGLVGISDTIRSEIVHVVDKARQAGVRTVMITGDHADTARIIAMRAGIYKQGDEVITARDLKRLSHKELMALLPKVSVFARVAPEEKLEIIEAYRKTGEIVAMTGDGVNDALSLAAADLGVSMGKTGTEVAKEASDIVLLDDNFSSIIAAIDEGRHIYNTIKKVILYLFATSLGEILTIAAAILIGFDLPVSASQIIWLNFVTDGFLVIALALEAKESNLITRARTKGAALIDKSMMRRIMLVSIVMTIGTLYVFHAYQSYGYLYASTMALTVLAVFQWFNAWNCRSDTRSVFNRNIFSNRFLVLSLFIVVALQVLVVYNPFFQKVLDTTAITFNDWMVAVGVSFTIILAEEVRKVFARYSSRR